MSKNFDGLKYFKPTSKTDNWGAPDRISRDLLLLLDLFREKVGSRVVVTSGFRPGNGASQHDHGRAADIMMPDFTGSLLELYKIAESVGFSGVGIYPHWKIAGKVLGGLHVDVRPGPKARWMGVLDAKGKQVNIGATDENLKKHNVV